MERSMDILSLRGEFWSQPEGGRKSLQQKFPVIVPSGTTDLVHTKTIDPNNVKTSLNSTALSNPHYTWTWTYSPNSESVSFRRIRSDSFLCATSSSPPVQHQEKSSIVTTPSVSPSALTRVGHHHVPPSVPANFGWTFNPQNEIATFRRLPKSVPAPQPPSCIRLLPAEDTDLPNATLACLRSLQSPCRNQIDSKPQPVLRISKRHRDALKVKMYHLYANILSMNWFYNTFD
eukprot:jgi/Psemu1/31101/gm1.31101_g